MPVHGRTARKRILVVTSATVLLLSVAFLDGEAQLPDASPPAETVPLEPSLIDFLTGSPVSATMQDLAKPKLLQKAFAGLPKEDPKGLASLIKAKELDVKNRVEAARYLGKVDCQQFPKSQLALKDLILDKFEPVRYEAAKSLKRQFGKGPKEGFCLPWPGKSKRKDACRGCCNTENIQEVIDEMWEQAYGCDAYGCPSEPSKRVRETLDEAIKLCANCECQESTPTQAEPLEPVVEPNVTPENPEGKPTGTKPAAPIPTEGKPKSEDDKKTDETEESKPAAADDAAADAAAAAGNELQYDPAAIGAAGSESTPRPTLPAPQELSEQAFPIDNAGGNAAANEPANLDPATTTEPDFLPEPEEPAASLPAPPTATDEQLIPEFSPATPTVDEAGSGLSNSNTDAETSNTEPQNTEIAPASFESIPEEKPVPRYQPLSVLKGHCLVELVENGSYVPASDSIYLNVEGYFDTYRLTFSSQEAQDKFQADPLKYFPVLDGYCVTTWSRTGMKMSGSCLTIHKGHCYCFALKTLGAEFNKDPDAILGLLKKKLKEARTEQ